VRRVFRRAELKTRKLWRALAVAVRKSTLLHRVEMQRILQSFGASCDNEMNALSDGAENQKDLESFGLSCEKERFVAQSRNSESFAELWCEL